MVLPSNSLPADGLWVGREIAAMKQRMQELTSAVAGLGAVQAQQATIQAQQAQIAAQVAYLAGQTITAVVTHNSTASGSSVSAAVVTFSGTDDAAVTFTVGSTGLVAVSAGGVVEATAYQAWARTGFGIQIVDGGGAQVFQPNLQGFYVVAPYVSAGGNAVGAPITIPLTAGQTYTARCRRMWEIDAIGASPSLAVTWRSSLISVTQLGM